jgi:hypothetical protein
MRGEDAGLSGVLPGRRATLCPMRRAGFLVAVLLLAGCGASAKPDHATLLDVDVHRASVAFTFDAAPEHIKTGWASRASLAECGSGRPVRPPGGAFYVIHFQPAQSQDVPLRVEMPSGPVAAVDKICDFEADVAWVIALDTRRTADVSTHGSTVTVTIGG